MYKGTECQAGYYYYQVTAKGPKGQYKSKSGMVLLFR